MNGGAGNDKLTGGDDADLFVKGMTSGVDTILDFDALADMIDLSAYSFVDDVDAKSHATQQGLNVLFTFTASDKLIVNNVLLADLDGGNILTLP